MYGVIPAEPNISFGGNIAADCTYGAKMYFAPFLIH